VEIADRVFIVSGGGSGLGAATVARLVAEGARVVIAEIDHERGREEAARYGEERVAFQRVDVADGESVAAAVEVAVDRFGGLHGVVGCAGVAVAERTVGRKGAHDLDLFRHVVEVNLVGMFNLIRLAAARMAEQEPSADGERGVIVATASIAAYDGQAGQAAYAASKGGIVGMTLPIARDLARFGIRMMTIAPGLFDTPILAGLPEEIRTQLGGQAPFPPRLGRPSEFADLVVHIIRNSMLNGEVIRLDGALRMPPR
jgi:NAD(P)-dependent dehydrogenase (short-subunit alcohol dehydrogenase family)